MDNGLIFPYRQREMYVRLMERQPLSGLWLQARKARDAGA